MNYKEEGILGVRLKVVGKDANQVTFFNIPESGLGDLALAIVLLFGNPENSVYSSKTVFIPKKNCHLILF